MIFALNGKFLQRKYGITATGEAHGVSPVPLFLRTSTHSVPAGTGRITPKVPALRSRTPPVRPEELILFSLLEQQEQSCPGTGSQSEQQSGVCFIASTRHMNDRDAYRLIPVVPVLMRCNRDPGFQGI